MRRGHEMQCLIFAPNAPAALEAEADAALVRFGPSGTAFGQMLSPCCCCGWGEEVFVTDPGCHRVAVYDAATGAPRRMLGGPGDRAGEFRRPFGVAVAEGCLVVSERDGRRLQVLTLLGAPLQVVGVQLGMDASLDLRGLWWDEDGHRLYLADFGASRILVLGASAERLRRLASRTLPS